VIRDLGQIQEFVAPEATQRVSRARDESESVGNRRQQLVADEVSVSVIDAFEVIKIDQKYCAHAALADHSPVG